MMDYNPQPNVNPAPNLMPLSAPVSYAPFKHDYVAPFSGFACPHYGGTSAGTILVLFILLIIILSACRFCK